MEYPPLRDFLDLRRLLSLPSQLFPLSSRGLGGTLDGTRRLLGSCPLAALPQVRILVGVRMLLTIEATTSTVGEALAVDGAIDPLPALQPDFIFPRLNISARQKACCPKGLGLSCSPSEMSTWSGSSSPVIRNKEKSRFPAFVAGRRTPTRNLLWVVR
ncbi:hypothetical protein B296_00044544 [Ensete ventricosum]|uniref:Uncharacterized protein n=1 Tax=Ensete ventricosum TaxID=4639 RepID=A0A426XS08_ENSVE|nr:hypothetical protein B296_00044544 [Ensete ventricosum]